MSLDVDAMLAPRKDQRVYFIHGHPLHGPLQILPALFKGLKEHTRVEDQIGHLESWPPEGVAGDCYMTVTRYFLTFEEARTKALEVIDTYEDQVRTKLLEQRAAILALVDTCRWSDPPEEIL